MWLVKLAMAVPYGSGAFALSIAGIFEPVCLRGLDQEFGAEVAIIALTTANALDVTGAAWGAVTHSSDCHAETCRYRYSAARDRQN
jgi:hypothetical protein